MAGFGLKPQLIDERTGLLEAFDLEQVLSLPAANVIFRPMTAELDAPQATRHCMISALHKPRDIGVMYNLGRLKGEGVRAPIEASGPSLLYLPPLQP